MFSERLEKLIQSSLQDGILTDQEKAAIIKRAKAEGEDIDEVEIYIDSLLQKRQKELNNSDVKRKANTSGMDELKHLIDAAMADGIITSKEREVITRKAAALGMDAAEVEVYLDAEEQKIEQQTDAAVRKQKGKQCPYCGGSIPLLTDRCPHCNENITPEASKELQEIFDNLEEALVDFKSGKDIAKSKATVERFMRKAKMYYGNNPKIQKLLEEVEMESAKAEKVAKANARKGAAIQFLANHKELVISAIVILAIFLGIKGCINSTEREKIEKEELYNQQYELDKPIIDDQYERLCKSLDELEIPNKSNFKEMTRKLQMIVWSDVSKSTVVEDSWNGNKYIHNDYEIEKREAFVKLKQAYAEELKTVYKQVYGKDNFYNYTPKEIEYPSDIRR